VITYECRLVAWNPGFLLHPTRWIGPGLRERIRGSTVNAGSLTVIIVCKNCGRENEDEFNFCLGCGSPIAPPAKAEPEPAQEIVNCPHCGTKVPGGFKFCGACGGALEGGQPVPAASSAEVARTVQAGGPRHAEEGQAARRVLGELTVIQPDGSEGARIPLTTDGLILGRESDFDVLANDPFLSPRHAELRFEDGTLKLRDLDSVNGVFWRLSDDVEVSHGDQIRVGQQLLVFQELSELDPVETKRKDPHTLLQGSPDPGIWARLSVVAGPDIESRAFCLASNDVTLGREIGTILFRDDGFVSGKHARIYRENGKVFLRDLGSSNGSYVRIRGERRVTRGDLILMGQQLFRVALN
jgi:pSer/pThr/pTyr-binding forkhead associated (FHA) protein/DNA-directed RNA polymerase subunit RPC12/RpoP